MSKSRPTKKSKSSSNSSSGLSNSSSPPQKKKQISPARYWEFTCNNYLKEDITKIQTICSSSSIKYLFQEETGESGTPHLQGCIDFGYDKKSRPLGLFNDVTSMSWRKVNNWQRTLAYCCKTETRTGGIFTNMKMTIPDKRLDNFVPRPGWQTELHDYIQNTEPNDREVIWVWGPKGNQGKSLWAKWMTVKYDNVICVTSNRSADICTAIKPWCRTFIIDIPRSTDITYTPFNAIEQIKNGFVTEAKLKKEMITTSFAPPHVVIFSNDKPDLDKLSQDRWKIIKID
jgi:hypothetical protein